MVVLASCGGGERHDATLPVDDSPTCPSEAAPERCRDLAQAAAGGGKPELAWAYTVLECESPTGAQCVTMWQRHAKLAPTQTDALNILHRACEHNAAACEQLAAWHTERGHSLAAAAYHNAPGSHTLTADLAAAMHLSSAPRTDAIAQMVGHQLRAPIVRAVASAPAKPKAWPMHAATHGSSSDTCAATAMRDRKPIPLSECVREVRPFEGDQIALLNRCGQPVTVAYAGARADHTTYANQLRLEPYEALGAGISHRELGPLTYGVCAGDCRVTSSPDDVTGSWTGQDSTYYCTRGGHP
jgi:hypothetical protein